MNPKINLSISQRFLGNNNNKLQNRKNQDSLANYFEPVEIVTKDPVAWFKSLTPAYQQVLSINSHFESQFEFNYASQQTKADMIGYCRDTVGRAEKYFREVGVMKSKKMGYTSNVNKISDWFRKNNLAIGISKIIPAFFCIAMLLSKPIVAREYSNDIFININSIAVNALERNRVGLESLGNILERTLSQFKPNINTPQKGDTVKQTPLDSPRIFSPKRDNLIYTLIFYLQPHMTEKILDRLTTPELEDLYEKHPRLKGVRLLTRIEK